MSKSVPPTNFMDGIEASRSMRTAKAKDFNRNAFEAILPMMAWDRIGTLEGLAEKLNKQGFSAPRGGQWSPTQVDRVIKSMNQTIRSMRRNMIDPPPSPYVEKPIDDAEQARRWVQIQRSLEICARNGKWLMATEIAPRNAELLRLIVSVDQFAAGSTGQMIGNERNGMIKMRFDVMQLESFVSQGIYQHDIMVRAAQVEFFRWHRHV